MTLVTPYFHHERVIGDKNGIFGDESDLSQKIISLVVPHRAAQLLEAHGGLEDSRSSWRIA
jgi:hypothetical protein